MPWNTLLQRLRASGDAHIERLADLLEMDLDGFTNTGSDGIAFGPNYGDHIPKPLQTHFQAEVQKWLTSTTGAASELIEALHNFFSQPTLRCFEHALNLSNRCACGHKKAVRYVGMDDFLQYFANSAPAFNALPNHKRYPDERRKRALNLLTKAIGRFEDFGFLEPYLAKPNGSGCVWITCEGGPAPHEVALSSGMLEDQACSYIVKQMGLPKFEGRENQAERIGVVGLVYELEPSTTLFRPTMLDAFPRVASELRFYPGPKGKEAGETLPLDDSLSFSGSRSVPGVQEWLHANRKVRLRGEGVKAEIWDAQVVWWGTWR